MKHKWKIITAEKANTVDADLNDVNEVDIILLCRVCGFSQAVCFDVEMIENYFAGAEGSDLHETECNEDESS